VFANQFVPVFRAERRMTQAKLFVIVFLVISLLAIVPPIASAEWSTDFHFGLARTRDAEVDVEISSTSLGFVRVRSATEKADFATSLAFGGRIGYWFENLRWLGFALDLSFFEAKDETVDITAIPLSLLLMFRWPLLKAEEFPNGRLQPYAGIGPCLFYSYSKVDFGPRLPETVSGYSSDLGVDVRAGIAWQFHKHMAMFGEYRHTRVSIEFEQTDILYGFAGNRETFDTTVKTNHFLMGISFRF
jgi:hypothetical protein